MIYLRFMCNLGNQMFQYAAARLAAERLGCALVISQDGFVWRDVLRGRQTMALFNAFPMLQRGWGGRVIDFSERYLPRISARLTRALFPIEFRPWSPGDAPREGLEGYHPGYRRLEKFTRMVGYFQSPLYLQGHEDQVRRWYGMSSHESVKTRRLWEQIGIDPNEAVAVHVRLGDYRQQPPLGDGQERGWVLPREYYQQALELASPGRRIALFSDEPDMAQALLGRKADYVARTGDSRIDFCMMSSCARMIIANSTYSWWAAWLNPNPSALIVAPKFFLGRNAGTWYPKDIRVEGWHYL